MLDKILSEHSSFSVFPLQIVRNSSVEDVISICDAVWGSGEKSFSIFTDRVRSTREGNIFSLCVSPHGGGYPIQLTGGYPIPGPGRGGTPSRSRQGGVPHPRSRWGGTSGTPQQGYPPIQVRSQDGGYPLLEQHSVYLLHHGRYVSCVHAGGLSCFH